MMTREQLETRIALRDLQITVAEDKLNEMDSRRKFWKWVAFGLFISFVLLALTINN